MPKIRLDQVEEGMTVARDVKNMDDMLLIPSGCELTARHIDLLHTWGVGEIQVEAGGEGDDAGDPLQRLSPKASEELATELKERFLRCEEPGPVQAEIYQLILRRRAHQILAE